MYYSVEFQMLFKQANPKSRIGDIMISLFDCGCFIKYFFI
jgi:hypothetical protein